MKHLEEPFHNGERWHPLSPVTLTTGCSDTHRYPTLVATVSKRCTIDGPIILQEKNTFLSCLCFAMLGDTVSVISV